MQLNGKKSHGVIILHSYPPGLVVKHDYFRVLKKTYTTECKQFILERMKASAMNIKPIIILDENTKKATIQYPNKTLTDITSSPVDILCLKVENIATSFILKNSS